jgi:D-inositol-3-phosphate glycosyltransferase
MSLSHDTLTVGSHHTPNKPRVAVLSYHTSPLAEVGGPQVGGMNVYVRELCQALGSRGYALDVFTRRSSPVAPQIQPFGPNARVINIDAGPPVSTAKEALPQYITAFTQAVTAFGERERLSYAMVASHYWMSGLSGVELAQLWHVPHVVMFHTLGEVKNRARSTEHETHQRIDAERDIISEADAITVASQHEADLLVELYAADRAKIVEVPCGIDLELFTPLPREIARSEVGLPQDARVILFVGRIEPLKGVDLLVAAAAELRDIDNLRAVIIGGDVSALPEIERLRAQARHLGIERRVVFLGAVEHAQLPSYYSAADVCVVPSFYESFGLAAIESMACGTPVVASKVGGLADTIIDGVTGFLVWPLEAATFAERLRRLLTHDDLRQSFSEAGQNAVERYRWSNIANEVANLYHRLLHEHAEMPSAV